MSKADTQDPFEQDFRELLSQDDSTGNLGRIEISTVATASIVKLATLEVPGVVSIGGTYVEKLAGLWKEEAVGITIRENERGDYEITIRVVLEYGLDLFKVASDIQANVKEQVERMTSKTVAQVAVQIGEVRVNPAHPAASESDFSQGQRDPWADVPHTD
jgi:uncharacterized alkaline shock family protein YloU